MSSSSSSASAKTSADAPDERPSRGAIIRDVVFFQMKLWLDGLKDVILSPLSIIGAVLDVVFRNRMEKSVFYMVLGLGERYDKWLNLYSAAKKGATKRGGMFDPEAGDDVASIDDLLRRAPELAKDVATSASHAPLQDPRFAEFVEAWGRKSDGSAVTPEEATALRAAFAKVESPTVKPPPNEKSPSAETTEDDGVPDGPTTSGGVEAARRASGDAQPTDASGEDPQLDVSDEASRPTRTQSRTAT